MDVNNHLSQSTFLEYTFVTTFKSLYTDHEILLFIWTWDPLSSVSIGGYTFLLQQ